MLSQLKTTLGAILVTTAISTAATADTTEKNKEIVAKGVASLFTNFDAAAAESLFAEDYIQHNPNVPTGRAPIIGFIPALKDSGISVETHRVLAEGDLVVTHNTYRNAQAFGADTLVAFDLFRVEDGKIAEHWDNLSPVTDPNPSGHTQTDGPTEITDLDKTEANKNLVSGFLNAILVGGEFDRVTDFISTETYIQHNSMIGDGLDGLGSALKALAEQGITMAYSDVHAVVAEGNFVFAMSEGTFGGKPTAFFDLFRVENGLIVEHWDVMSDIPAEMAHENGKF